jgi:hypothetical protein
MLVMAEVSTKMFYRLLLMAVVIGKENPFMKGFSLSYEYRKAIPLYKERPIPGLYTGEFNWYIPDTSSLRDSLETAYTKGYAESQQWMMTFKNKMFTYYKEWTKECLQ